MTTWSSIIPATGTVDRASMVAELQLYAGLVGEAGAWPSIASAATTEIDAGAAAGAGLVEITGTTTILSFGTGAPEGRRKWLLFAGALTLTHSASLVLPAGANMTTEAGTLALAARTSAGWRVLDVRRPSLMTPDSIDVTGAIRSYLQNNRVRLAEIRADGTHNGSTVAGSWQARNVVLTEIIDPGDLATVTGASFDLVAGTYDVEMRQVLYGGQGGVRTRLYNVTDAVAVAGSLSVTINNWASSVTTNYWVESRFRMSIVGTKTFQMEYYTTSAVASFGLGAHDGLTVGDEHYSTVDILRVG